MGTRDWGLSLRKNLIVIFLLIETAFVFILSSCGFFGDVEDLKADLDTKPIPVADDFDINGLTRNYTGSPQAVIVTPKPEKSGGIITVFYEGTEGTFYDLSEEPPTEPGTYLVTFNVAAAQGFKPANGLCAGTLVIVIFIDPAAEDYEIAGLVQGYDGSPKAVNITPKPDASGGAITVWYEGTGGTNYSRRNTPPSAFGKYLVTFDVAEAPGINAAIGLIAGTLVIVSPGTGTHEDPFIVFDEDTLRKVGTEYTAGGWTLDASYRQMADINLLSSGKKIGDQITKFRGVYDGGGFTINNFTNTLGNSYYGLFGYITEPAVVKNVRLTNINIKGSHILGGVAAYNERGTIENCSVSGSIEGSGSGEIGGIAGVNNAGMVRNCFVEGSVYGVHDKVIVERVGGVVGRNGGTVINCRAEGNVLGDKSVGGVVGWNDGLAECCYTAGIVSGDTQVGGITGYNNGAKTVRNCVALNPELNAGADFGRVAGDYWVGYGGDGIFTNNYANSGMLVNGSTVNSGIDAAGINGADVSAGTGTGQYNNQTWWSAASGGPRFDFSESGPWTWDEDASLPVLK